MSADSKLNDARRKVQLVLKDKMSKYLSLMGSWFRGKMSKGQFDSLARDLFTDDTVKAHNELLLAMLHKCQSVTGPTSSKELSKPSPTVVSPPLTQKQKPVKKKIFAKTNFSQRFQPANQLRQVRALPSPPEPTTDASFVSSSNGLLPDEGMVEGRLYVAAWEAGLEGVHNQIYSLVCLSTESLLKDIISHVLSCRRGYKMSKSLSIKQHIGLDVPLVYLPSTADPSNQIVKAQHEEANAVQTLARAGHMPPGSQPITCLDMYTALQSNPDVIGSFTLYTLAMERLCTRFYHPESQAESQPQTASRKRRFLSIT